MRTKAFNILCLMLVMALPFSSFGADFIVDDIHYNIIGDNSVEVTYSAVIDYTGSITYYGSGRWKTFVILPETVTDPNTGIEYTVTAIGDYAFTKSYPRFISIPNTVTSIGCQAFYLCENLSYINIPASVTSIGNKAFGYHTSSICINGCFTTDGHAFSLEQKKRVIIGPNLARAPDLTGKDMYVLSTTPPERSKISSNAYVNLHVPPGCSSVYFMSEAWGNAYTIKDDAVAYDNFEIDRHEMTLAAGEKGKIKLTMSPSTSLPRNWISTDPDVATISYTGEVTAKKEGKTTIIVYSADRYQLCEVTVTSGSVNAYFDIHSLSLNVEQMEIITPTFTTTVTDWKVESSRPDVVAMQIYNNDRIRLMALKPGVAKITVSSPTVDIKSDTCVVTVNGEVLDADFTVDGLHYMTTDGKTVTVTYTDDSDGYKNNYAGLDVAAIPSTVTHDGTTYTVTAVGGNAFRGCTILAQVTLPSTLESIGNLAFYKCTALTAISVPASVKQVSGTAFGSCSGLGSITVAAGNPVYDSREGCNAIIETATGTLVSGCKNTVVPSSVTAIGNDAFSGHSGLSVITLPPSITSIGNGAFYSCTSLSRFVIPEHVESVGNNAFRLCGKLASVRLPSSVTTIGNGAFSNCASLATATLCSGIAQIGDNAFSGDKKLEKVICSMPSPESITYGTSIFTSVPVTTCRLFVPDNAVDSYSAISPWSDFLNIVGLSSLADLTGDGAVNVGDISELYRLILNGESPADADLNLDGQVNAGDVSTLYGIILSQ